MTGSVDGFIHSGHGGHSCLRALPSGNGVRQSGIVFFFSFRNAALEGPLFHGAAIVLGGNVEEALSGWGGGSVVPLGRVEFALVDPALKRRAIFGSASGACYEPGSGRMRIREVFIVDISGGHSRR